MKTPRSIFVLLVVLGLIFDIIIIRTGFGTYVFILLILAILIGYIAASVVENRWLNVKEFKDWWF